MKDSVIKFPVHDRVVLVDSSLLATNEGAERVVKLIDVGSNLMRKATVLSIGAACTQLKVGDLVAHFKEKGIEILFDDVRYLIIRENDTEFVLNKDKIPVDEKNTK